MLITVTDLVTGSLQEIKVARGGDLVRAEDLALMVQRLNEVLERLPVTPEALYTSALTTYALTPSLQPHTIGPTGTFVVARRPVAILQANVVLPGSASRTPVRIRTESWWMKVRTRLIESSIPSDLYYRPTYPDGEINLWPVPTANSLEIRTRDEIGAVDENTTLDLPQGYTELLRLWTAKKGAPSFSRTWSAESEGELIQVMTSVFGANCRANDLQTRDGGLPGGMGGLYDYRTGMFE